MTSRLNRQLAFYSIEDYDGYDSSSCLFRTANILEVRNPYLADVIIFNGGTDIGTEIYGEKSIGYGIPEKMSLRDIHEISLFNSYKNTNKLLLGICRGAQLLNCLNGGSLWQHVNNHGRTHEMLDLASGRTYDATSTHHQMMRPNLETGKVLAVASESTTKLADGLRERLDPNVNPHLDVEIVWYPETHSLCIQGHPEYVPGSVFANYCLDLIHNCWKEVCYEPA